MYKTGNVVIKRNITKDGINPNIKNTKLYVVLFNYYLDDEEFICTCPITNYRPTKQSKNYLYIPYEILTTKRYCSIKLNEAPIFKSNEITLSGLSLKRDIILKIYNKILDLNTTKVQLNQEHYTFIKNNIKVLIDDLLEEEKRMKKDIKKQRKQLKKERKRKYKEISK